ncbi:All-trans-zeta-carotene desaturase [Aquirufa nivalisilvae]|uniref:All-trans-zeta-carotene desaturase n=2 Tax=Aquirufa nivalisilvae TaxID=2516557 RepID=A0A2S2DXT5_9BACT|nr:All-trans-zeta-carotene desaturase [Aquirufa nivalisilvae]MCZ2479883.1 phytoene desaturase [Aquirufa nivalisilvae]
MTMKQVGVVGSGVGGLAFAIRMACLGHQVQVFEANSFPGGKLSEFQINGFRFDAGPSLFTLPHLVDELFTLANKNPRDYFDYQRLPEVCRYFWEDHTRLVTLQNAADTAHEIAKNLGENEKNILDFILGLQEKYQIISELFLENSLHQASTWLSKKAWNGYLNIPQLGMFSTMHHAHKNRFKNAKTVQLFDRYATYNGSDPYQTPATLSIIPHLEYNIGAFFPRGGMIAITQSMYQLATDLGVQFHFNEKVNRILCENKQAVGLETAQGEYPFDILASNMDIRPSYQQLLLDQIQPKRLLQQEKSSSGIIFYWGMSKQWAELGVHNIFFSEQYQAEFKALFTDKTLSDDPTVYLHISSKVAPEDAPLGGENWFILINAPANEGQNWDELLRLTRERIIQKISRALGEDISSYIVVEDYLDPRRIEERTSSSGGALYGNASNNRFAAFLRHPNYRSAIKNLYWIGGSVHPGGGIPLCLSSAKIAAKLFQENA